MKSRPAIALLSSQQWRGRRGVMARSGIESNLSYAPNKTGATNLLKTVRRPLGGVMNLEYQRTPTTYDDPNTHWTLSQVRMQDGHAGDGVDVQTTSYAYERGYHDRFEREFYGFAKVTATQQEAGGAALRSQSTEYFNHDYYRKGLVTRSLLSDARGKPWTQSLSEYRVTKPGLSNAAGDGWLEFPAADVESGSQAGSPVIKNNEGTVIGQATGPAKTQGSVFVQAIRSVSLAHEGQAAPGKAGITTMAYDRLGNVSAYCDLGDIAVESATTRGDRADTSGNFTLHPERTRNDDVCARISYTGDGIAHPNDSTAVNAYKAHWITGSPTRIQVYAVSNTSGTGASATRGCDQTLTQSGPATPVCGYLSTQLRERRADIAPVTGGLTAVHQDPLDTSGVLTTRLTYHLTGTLKTITDPAAYVLTYDYEPVTASQLSKISDSFGDYAQTQYSPATLKFGLPEAVLDLNGQRMGYTYDAYARTAAVQGPYETGTTQTLRYQYASLTAATGAQSIYWARSAHLQLNCGPTVGAGACLSDYRKNPDNTDDTLDTLTFSDGAGRIVPQK